MQHFDSFQDLISQIYAKTGMFNGFWQPFWVDNIDFQISNFEIWL